MRTMTYSQSRAHYAEVLDLVVGDREEVVITRPGREPAVIVALSEYEALKETDYLLRNPINAAHLRRAIADLDSGRGIERELIE